MADHDATPEEIIPPPAGAAEPVPPQATDHEESDVSITGLGEFLIAMAVGLVVVGGLVYWQYRRFEWIARANDPTRIPRADERRPPPEPHLQVDEVNDMATLRAKQEAILQSTAWVNRNENLVRIPIDRALAIVAEKGIRRWPTVAAGEPSAKDDAKGQPPATGADADQKPPPPSD